MNRNIKIAFVGAGAIGGSVGAWVSEHYADIYFLDQGDTNRILKEDGIEVYYLKEKDRNCRYRVNVLNDMKDLKGFDVIVLGVKNYSLDKVASDLRQIAGDDPVIVSMANGSENQTILPKYFSKVVYCVVSYNAWMDRPVVVGYQKKGPLVLGTPDNTLQNEMKLIAEIFNRGVETIVTNHLEDAVHSKIIINLTNSVNTLVGQGFVPISDMKLFQKILCNTLREGVEVVKAAGYHECKLGGMPSWKTIHAAAMLPQFLTSGAFKKNVSKMQMSSMAQDILLRHGTNSEVESLNGYIVTLADKSNIRVPYNRTVYQLAKDNFSVKGFRPMDVRDVWHEILKNIRAI